MTTLWTIKIDWDRNGNYTDSYDDVTNRVISANWFLGMRKPYQTDADDSRLELVLNNFDKLYSPECATLVDGNPNPLFGKIAPFRTVWAQSDDGTTTRTHWVGWVEKIEPKVNANGERTVAITAAGPMQFFKAAETNIALQENQRTDQIIAKLLQEVVIPPALSAGWFLGMAGYSELGVSTRLARVVPYSDLEAGRVTLAIAADNWVQRGSEGADEKTFNVYRALADVTAAERGRFLFDREGKALFWNRTHLQDEIVSSVTLNDSMSDLEYAYAGVEDFKNEVVVVCHPRTVGASADDILWSLTEEVRVEPGKTRSVSVRYQDETDKKTRVGAKEVTLIGVTFSEGDATVTLEAKANSATLKIENKGTKKAILKTAIVRGCRITDYGQMEAKAQDNESIARYGRRSMKMNLPSVDNLDYAEGIAGYEIKRRGKPRGVVSQVKIVGHGTLGGGQHALQLARTLGDVITISETQTGHTNRRYVIIGEAHRLTKGATLLETTWYVEPAKEAPFPWKLGQSGRSNLGASTRLAF